MEQKAIETLDKLELIAKQITDKLIEVAPKAYEVLLTIKQVEAGQELIKGLICLIISLILSYITFKIYKKLIKTEQDLGLIMLQLASPFAIAVIPLFPAISILTNLWDWIGLINPELAIAKDIKDGIFNNK